MCIRDRCPSVPWIQAEKPLEAHSPGEPFKCLSHEPMELIRRLQAVVSATSDRQPSSCEQGLRRSGGLLVVLLERFCNCRQSRSPFHQSLPQPHRACQQLCSQTSATSRPPLRRRPGSQLDGWRSFVAETTASSRLIAPINLWLEHMLGSPGECTSRVLSLIHI